MKLDGIENLVYLDDGLYIDVHLNRVVKNGFILPFSATQARLIKRLSQDMGKPISSAELIRYIWGEEGISRNADLYTCVNRIRSRIGDSGKKYLLSVHKVGYMLVSYATMKQ
ncbi:winged helix-turn-helix domain-containing protein [Ferroacidibacillus organovorans]|uniref:OmpR/PhoB-type domain-containing protein n=1 Tax=Ferroacidibacillus organovorans TaxID=1765683 RepID=A0A1V4EVA3_9BACL|nr:winged helix-turn-helix domain-containing protein [Ferroacidibacillus organovorans]OPG16770.1 hypothetical protein B2M26_05275 [Ferroacidibacillus organovorans]